MTAADLNGADFIGFDEDLKIRRELDRYLKAAGIDVNFVMHFDNIQTIKEAVALGSGISILPARTMQAEIAQGSLVAVKLNAPAVVGVPLRPPLALKLKPGGRLPLATAHWYGRVPPVAVKFSTYADPVRPEVKGEDEVIASGGTVAPEPAHA